MNQNSKFVNNTIIVALLDMNSVDGNESIKEGTVDRVSISGSSGKFSCDWVIGFIDRRATESYYKADKEIYFRLATESEIEEFNKKGRYTIDQPKFKIGDKIVALDDITTTEDEYSVKKGEEKTIEDIIVNKKDINKSIFWFPGHKGVFTMEDNFKLKD